MSDTDAEAAQSPRRKSAKPKLSGSVHEERQAASHLTILFYRSVLVSFYFSLIIGLAFFLTLYYLFIWEPVRGNYSSHHVFLGHSSPVFHPEGRWKYEKSIKHKWILDQVLRRNLYWEAEWLEIDVRIILIYVATQCCIIFHSLSYRNVLI